ncbi:MAG: ABC transporter substrate-binding protein [Betaproteobacteria bacterium]|nr:MAG: ABC transporter substrate-binding protein [Betaproteobacteria bacterium]
MNNRMISWPTAVLGVFMLAGTTAAAEIQVIASSAFREVYLELVPQFEQMHKHKVVASFSSSPDIMKRAKAGESADLFILASSSVDELIKLGKVVPSSRVDLAKSGVGIAVRAGAPKPDISSSDAVKRALLAAKSIGYSGGASGAYITELFQRMGIADELKPKLRQAPLGVPVGELIARGEVEIGFHQMSELLPVAGIDILGPLPADIQQFTVFSAGVSTGAKTPDAAKELVKFLTAPGATPLIRKKGMEPA